MCAAVRPLVNIPRLTEEWDGLWPAWVGTHRDIWRRDQRLTLDCPLFKSSVQNHEATEPPRPENFHLTLAFFQTPSGRSLTPRPSQATGTAGDRSPAPGRGETGPT
jgi:hypothetical protein